MRYPEVRNSIIGPAQPEAHPLRIAAVAETSKAVLLDDCFGLAAELPGLRGGGLYVANLEMGRLPAVRVVPMQADPAARREAEKMAGLLGTGSLRVNFERPSYTAKGTSDSSVMRECRWPISNFF